MKTVLVHTLVANKFLEKPQGIVVVHHKDGDKSNNKVSNLEFVPKTYEHQSIAINVTHKKSGINKNFESYQAFYMYLQ